MKSEEKYWIERAETEIEKAKKIYHNLNKLSEEAINILLEKLLNAINFLAKVILLRQKKINRFAQDNFSMLTKDILKSYKIEESFYEIYFYIRDLLSNGLVKIENGYLTRTWKSKAIVTNKQIYDLILKIQGFIDVVEKRIELLT